jgi:hypothetical protein
VTGSDLHLLVLTEAQCALIIRAMGHYCPESDEECDALDTITDKITGHLPVVHEPPC